MAAKPLPPLFECPVYYVYIITIPDGSLYIGYSTDLKERTKKHRQDRHFKDLIYHEAYRDKNDVVARERQLKKYKSSWGHLKKRIKCSIQGI